MIKKNYIGITGFTEKEQIINTINFIDLIQSKRNYMFGFLVSSKTIKFEKLNNKRYLNFSSFQELKELMSYSANKENIINMIHYNTQEKNFSKELIPLLKELGNVVEAIQFNLNFIEIEEFKILRNKFPNIKFVFQYNNSILKKYSKIEIFNTLKEIQFEYMLIDLSGGKGIDLNPILLKNTYDLFNLYDLDINLGIAGGLSGYNVFELTKELNLYKIDYFIDAESKLRDKLSNVYGDDIWNQDKVNCYIDRANLK